MRACFPCSFVWLLLLWTSLSLACSALVNPDPDRLGADPGADAGSHADGGSRPDAGRPDDAGGPRDGGTTADAGVRDAGPEGCPAGCDDGVDCTVDSCVRGRCEHAPDHDYCFTNRALCIADARCEPSSATAPTGCVAGPEVECDDRLSCTEDACDPTTGQCTYTPQDARCADTVDCTVDACEPAEGTSDGCVHRTEDARCPTSYCTVAVACMPDGCTDGTPRDCRDRSACTTDSCSDALGRCVYTPTDADGDGYPAMRVGGERCAGGTDCDDSERDVHPNAREICGNNIDDDCDGMRDEGCGGCSPVGVTCPAGWAYSNDGTYHHCTAMFSPPTGAREYCRYAGMGYVGFYWPLGTSYSCPAGARYAASTMYGFCLWDGISLPSGAMLDCSGVARGYMEYHWAC